MIIALLALAFAMILGGLLAAIFGWDIVLVERGWTMVLAGSFTAACGAVLLGITAVVSKLGRIQSELSRLQVSLADEEQEDEAPSSSDGVSMAALAGGMLGGRMFGRGEEKAEDERPADLPLFANDDKGEPADEERAQGEEPELQSRVEPPLPFPPTSVSEESERRAEDDDIESRVPDFLLAERLRDTFVETRSSEAEMSSFVDEPKLDEPEEERRTDLDHDDILEPLPEPAPILAPEPVLEPEQELAVAETDAAASEESAREEKTVEEPRSTASVIGTYNSGDNTYVMFSDGSIEAQTPGGVFHFNSLDELKAFIASGGEGGTAST